MKVILIYEKGTGKKCLVYEKGTGKKYLVRFEYDDFRGEHFIHVIDDEERGEWKKVSWEEYDKRFLDGEG